MTATPLALAALVSPALFYGGLASVSLPILIHLLAKRRFKRVRWAAMEFVLLAERENRRWLNLRELILLLLRCLAVFIIGSLLARPFLTPGYLAGLVGAEHRRQHFVLVDDSLSMSYSVGGQRIIDRAAAAVAQLLEQQRGHGPNDRVTVLLSSAPDTPLVDGVMLENVDVDSVQSQLASVPLSAINPDFDALFAALRQRVLEQDASTKTAVVAVSDFQYDDWIQTGRVEDGRCCLNRLRDWPAERARPEVLLIRVAATARENAAVEALFAESGQLIWGIDNRMTATVANHGTRGVPDAELEILVDGAVQQRVDVPELLPGAQADVHFSLSFPAEGATHIVARRSPDHLAADDQRGAVFEILPALNVLLVNGEPGLTRLDDEVGLLATALNPAGEVSSGVHVDVIDETQLDSAELDDYHVVVLANVYRVSEAQRVALHAYVTAGGGLAIFLGDQVDATAYNATMLETEAPLLPCALGQVVMLPPNQPARLSILNEEHPAVRVFAGQDNPFLQGVGFNRYLECTPELTTAVVAAYGSDPQHAAIVDSRIGAGRVILMTSTADLEWTDWPKSTSYLVTVLELAQALARPPIIPPALEAGGAVIVPLSTADAARPADWQTPRYPTEPMRAVAPTPTVDGRAVWQIRPVEPGVHRLRGSGGGPTVGVAVHASPRESRLRGCEVEDLRRAAPEVPFEIVTENDAIQGGLGDARREIWPALLIALVVVLMTEQTLACWFGKS
jgi:hypothetical protein